MQVLPRSADLSDGRPRCLLGAGRRPVRLRLSARPTDALLVQAFGTNERSDAVPLDQAIVGPGGPGPNLFLPSMSVRFVTRRN